MDYSGPDLPATPDRDEDPAHTMTREELAGEIAKLRDDMRLAAQELRFEEAARIRDRVRILEELELRR